MDCTHWRGLSDAAIVHAGMSETEHRFSRDFQCEKNVTARDLDVGASLQTPIVAPELGGLESCALF